MIFKKLCRKIISFLISLVLLISFSNPPIYIPRDVFVKKEVIWVVEGEDETWDEVVQKILLGLKKVTLRYVSGWVSHN